MGALNEYRKDFEIRCLSDCALKFERKLKFAITNPLFPEIQ